ncbi:MAG: hypothetical protein ACJ79S_15105 [Gemmatimonadaceae bacterium]
MRDASTAKPPVDPVPAAPPPAPSDWCAYCGRPFAPDEETLVLMRHGAPVASFHERCHPHHRRSGCSAC